MNKIMTHVIAGYPSFDECIDLMRGMEKAGVNMIEVQVPFSDPIADGETIMRANDVALANGMTTDKSFTLIKDAGLKIDVFIMSYFQKIHHFGIAEFCQAAVKAGLKALIVPDLPYDSPEFGELLAETQRNNLNIVPVISPGMDSSRLQRVVELSNGWIYLTSIKGITGKSLRLNDDLIKIAKAVKQIKPKTQLAIGFGIKTKEEVRQVLNIADIAVIGSAVIRKIDSEGTGQAINFVKGLVNNSDV